MICAVSLGAEQTAFFGAAPEEAQGARRFVFRLCKMLCHGQKTDGTGHIVIRTLRKRRRVIVRCEDDDAVGFAGNVKHDVLGVALVFVLRKRDFCGCDIVFNQRDRILCVDVHAGELLAVGCTGTDIRAQLTLVDIAVGIKDIAVVGNEAHSTVFDEIMVHPITEIPVDEHDFTADLGQLHFIAAGGQIVKRRFRLAGAGTQIPLARNLLCFTAAERDRQRVFRDGRHVDDKRVKACLQTERGTVTCDVFGSCAFRVRAAGADIGGIRKNFFNNRCIHMCDSFLCDYRENRYAVTVLRYSAFASRTGIGRRRSPGIS